jgi:hypothetical protein
MLAPLVVEDPDSFGCNRSSKNIDVRMCACVRAECTGPAKCVAKSVSGCRLHSGNKLTIEILCSNRAHTYLQVLQ